MDACQGRAQITMNHTLHRATGDFSTTSQVHPRHLGHEDFSKTVDDRLPTGPLGRQLSLDGS